MKFTNNQFQFEASDVSQRTSLEQSGISAKCMESQTPEQWLTTILENEIGVAAAAYQEQQVQNLRPLGEAIAGASPEQLAKIEPLIAQAQEILGTGK